MAFSDLTEAAERVLLHHKLLEQPDLSPTTRFLVECLRKKMTGEGMLRLALLTFDGYTLFPSHENQHDL
jgi:hypothetical protein